MNKIRVIDLLNKIANGEEPQKIKYDNVEFVYGAFTMEGDFLEGLDGKSYNGEKSGYWSKEQNGWFEYYIDFDSLNDEVEILEEEKKIPEKIRHDACWIYDDETNQLEKITLKDDLILNKLDDIIDYLDHLKSKGE